MRRALLIKLLAGLVLLLAVVYAVARLDNWMAIRSIDTPPAEPPQAVPHDPAASPVSETSP